MTATIYRSRRVFDLALALALSLVLVLPIAAIALVLLVLQGRPVLHRSERMRGPEASFTLLKFRTMRVVALDCGVSGGDKAGRITVAGHFLRRSRLDELPQLWNILCGDMGFVGPRPPLRDYVERFPDLYAAVLRDRPGLTGFATLHFHRREAALLAQARNAAETDAIYAGHCVPEKARLDLAYQAERTLAQDIRVLAKTLLALCGSAPDTPFFFPLMPEASR